MTTETRQVLISDLSTAEPKSALTRKLHAGCWRMVDYETEDGIRGVMLFATPEDQAGELTIPLEVSGLHAIYLGINYTRAGLGDVLHTLEWPMYGTLWARLTDDPGFSRFAPEIKWRQDANFPNKTGKAVQIWHAIHETYWKTADVTGQALTIRPPSAPYNIPELRQVTNLSYIRLVPLTDAELNFWQREQPSPDTRRLAVQYCTGELSGHTSGTPMYHPTDEQWIRDAFTPFLNTDIGMICFEAIRGNLCMFRTQIGDVGTPENVWSEEWIDPLAVATKVAHENGIKLLVGIRMIGASLPAVRHPIQWARYYWAHQKWAKRDPQGRPCSNLSIAFPEVRQYWLSLIREALERDCDGVHLLFDRCFPFVLYEEPSLQAFREKYGADPRGLESDDPRWVSHQCDVVTQFLREVRAVLDERPGRELAIHFRAAQYGPWYAMEPRQFGCDVETWIREELVDYLMPTPAGMRLVEGPDLSDSVRRWKELGEGRVKIYPDLFPRTQPGYAYAELAQHLYAVGADGFIMRDCERRHPRASEWAVARRLGHRHMLDELRQRSETYWRRVELKVLNGLSVPYSFNDG